jgi:hypothetical protein
MKKVFSRRPSAGVVIGFVALCVALGGGAYAANNKKVEYKGLSKDARLKVQPVSATNAGTKCDPDSNATYKICTSVDMNVSTAYPRRVLLIFDGSFDGTGGVSRGDCRLQLDGNPLNGTTIRVETPTHTTDHGDGYGINIVTTPQGGKHTYSVACNETAGDLKVQQFQLSAATVR